MASVYLNILKDWLYSVKDKFWKLISPYWNSYGQPYWKYGLAFTMGSLTFTMFAWNFTTKLTNTTTIQLAFKIHSKNAVQSLNKNPKEIHRIWKEYRPKCPTQPSTELLASYMMIRGMEFLSFKHCPKNRNKYEWFIEQHRDDRIGKMLQPTQPSFVREPQIIVIDEEKGLSLHKLCYYNEQMQDTDLNKCGVLYHIFGGSFIGGCPQSMYAPLYQISRATGMVILSIDYRLCHDEGVTISEQVDDCVNGYRYLLKTLRVSADKICVMGESSGATLVLLLLQKLKLYANESGIAQPKCAVLQSPVTDLSYSLPSIRGNQKYDCFEGFVEFPNPCLDIAVGNVDKSNDTINKKDAKYSPLYGDWNGICDLFFVAGEHEMLFDDSVHAVEKAKQCDVNVEYYWDPFCGHCPAGWSMMCPEGEFCMAIMMDYIKRKMMALSRLELTQ
eukprot:549091_1